MNEWPNIQLKDCLVEKGYIRGPFGSALKRGEMQSDGIPVYEQKNAIYGIRYFRFFIGEEKYREMSRFTVKTGDFIVSCSGTVGHLSEIKQEDPKGIISQALLILRSNPHEINRSFLRHYLSSSKGRNQMLNRSTGSVQVNLASRKIIETIPIPYPPQLEQKAIAEVLSSLDDKIDLLRRQNKTLEGMAEALFRQWFIEEAQHDWDELPFGEVFDFTMGQSPPGSSFNEEGVGMPMYQGNADFGMRFPSARVYTTEAKRMAGPGDVLMSVRAPVGAMNMAKEKCCIGRGVAAFRFKEEPSFDTYTLYKIKAMISEFMVFNDQGTVFGSIGKGDLLQMVVTSPPFNLIEKFEAEVGPLDHKIRANANEIVLLERKRDTLLPKLMSGEVRVQMD